MVNNLDSTYQNLQAYIGFENSLVPVIGVYRINQITSKGPEGNRWYHAICNWKEYFGEDFDTSFEKQICLNYLFYHGALGPIDIKKENILKLQGKTLQIEDVIAKTSKAGKTYPKVVWNLYNGSFYSTPSEIAKKPVYESFYNNDSNLSDNEVPVEIVQSYESDLESDYVLTEQIYNLEVDTTADELLLAQIYLSDEVNMADLELHLQALEMDDIYEIEYFQALEMDEVSEDNMLLHQQALDMDVVSEYDLLLIQAVLKYASMSVETMDLSTVEKKNTKKRKSI